MSTRVQNPRRKPRYTMSDVGAVATWLFAEFFTGAQVVGALLVLAAVAVIQFQPGSDAVQEIQPPGS